MSEELLKINKLATLSELRYILLEVLVPQSAIELSVFNSTCQKKSWHLALALDDTLSFLEILSLVKINAQKYIISNLSAIDISKIRSDHSFSIFLAQKVIENLAASGFLPKLFNNKVLVFDAATDSWTINLNHLPFKYPFVKNFLLSIELVVPDKFINSKVVIPGPHKMFFKEEILDRLLLIQDVLVENEKHAKEYRVFISYTYRDEQYKEELKEHLMSLVKRGIIKALNERVVLNDYSLEESTKQNISEADIVLFLVSSAFISSDYALNIEIKKAIDKHNRKVIVIVPVIIRPCDFSSLPLDHYQATPKDAMPISKWDDKDEAYLNVVDHLKMILR